MINVATAGQLLDFPGPRHSITDEAAEEQLRGAVALHSILKAKRVAYLSNFDDPDQTENAAERQVIGVGALNGLAQSCRATPNERRGFLEWFEARFLHRAQPPEARPS